MNKAITESLTLADSCVYTIIAPERLLKAAHAGDPLTENRRWVAVRKFLREAHRNKVRIPIVFGNAAHCIQLVAWSVLSQIAIRNNQTTFRIEQLYEVGSMKRGELTVVSSGDPIPESHIRPYVLCQTPASLRRLALRPTAWSYDLYPDLDLDSVSGREGKQRLEQHLRRERKRTLIAAKKRAVLQVNGRLQCEVCGFDFKQVYGTLGDGFCEVHHLEGLSDNGERVTGLDDLAVVCSNCHRMLHRGKALLSVRQLRSRLRKL